MKLIPLTLIALLVTAIAAMAAQDCRYHKYPSGREYIYNTGWPGGQCSLSCRYEASYEDPDQCSHGLASLSDSHWRPNFSGNKRNNPYLNALCRCETPLISRTFGTSGYLFCGENNDEWVYAGYPITMNLHGWQWRMNLTYHPEYVCGG